MQQNPQFEESLNLMGSREPYLDISGLIKVPVEAAKQDQVSLKSHQTSQLSTGMLAGL